MRQPAEIVSKNEPKILDRLRMDLQLGRHHPRGTASAHLIRKWGFRRVMKHIGTIRSILDRVEAEEMLRTGGDRPAPMRKRQPFPGDLRKASRATGGTAGKTMPRIANGPDRRLPR